MLASHSMSTSMPGMSADDLIMPLVMQIRSKTMYISPRKGRIAFDFMLKVYHRENFAVVLSLVHNLLDGKALHVCCWCSGVPYSGGG